MKTKRSKNKVFPVEKGQCRAIGIDLGTTYSCVGVWQHGRVEIIADGEGNRTTPSCVSFTKDEHLTGDAAKNQIGSNPANTIYSAKRLIGRTFFDAPVQHGIKHWPFKVVAGPGTENKQKPMIVVTHEGEEKQFAAEEISAMVLNKMKETAEFYLGSKVTDAVVTVPAHFNASQRQATKDAGDIAGLNIIRLINEPVAAAVAYAFKKKKQSSKTIAENVLVFDFGGGTLDVSLLNINKNIFKVNATVGDANLGGDNIDDRMVSYFVEEFKRKHGKDISGNTRALARLRSACERAKRVLSRDFMTTIEIDCLYESTDFCSPITRACLEKLNEDLFKRSMDCVTKCVQDGKIDMCDVHTVVLVGGSSRIPKVQIMLQNFFKEKQFYRGIVNPEEAVAYGATILSEMLSGMNTESKSEFVDRIPLSLGIKVDGGGMSVIAPKNTTIPSKNKKVYTTVCKNQKTVRFSVYEGEKRIAKRNKRLNRLELTGIPDAPAGKPYFDVHVDINSAGILTVSSEHRGTANKKQITITNHSMGMQVKLERMLEDAKKNKAKDGSHQMKLNESNNNFKVFAGAMLKRIHKKLNNCFINCFDIRD